MLHMAHMRFCWLQDPSSDVAQRLWSTALEIYFRLKPVELQIA